MVYAEIGPVWWGPSTRPVQPAVVGRPVHEVAELEGRPVREAVELEGRPVQPAVVGRPVHEVAEDVCLAAAQGLLARPIGTGTGADTGESRALHNRRGAVTKGVHQGGRTGGGQPEREHDRQTGVDLRVRYPREHGLL